MRVHDVKETVAALRSNGSFREEMKFWRIPLVILAAFWAAGFTDLL